jgi:hypothetical protein
MLASHNFRGKIEKSFERLHYVEKKSILSSLRRP